MPVTFKLLTFLGVILPSMVFSRHEDSENGAMCIFIFISSRDSSEPKVDKTFKLQNVLCEVKRDFRSKIPTDS